MPIRVPISLADIEIQFLNWCQMIGKLSANNAMVSESFGELVYLTVYCKFNCGSRSVNFSLRGLVDGGVHSTFRVNFEYKPCLCHGTAQNEGKENWMNGVFTCERDNAAAISGLPSFCRPFSPNLIWRHISIFTACCHRSLRNAWQILSPSSDQIVNPTFSIDFLELGLIKWNLNKCNDCNVMKYHPGACCKKCYV